MFIETASGAAPSGPVLEQDLDQLRPDDTLVVWKLDRLGRSLRHLVDTVTAQLTVGLVPQPSAGDRYHYPWRQAGVSCLRGLG
jgi:Resolvase, N terminal domain